MKLLFFCILLVRTKMFFRGAFSVYKRNWIFIFFIHQNLECSPDFLGLYFLTLFLVKFIKFLKTGIFWGFNRLFLLIILANLYGSVLTGLPVRVMRWDFSIKWVKVYLLSYFLEIFLFKITSLLKFFNLILKLLIVLYLLTYILFINRIPVN